MITVGITGQNGFIGQHLYNTINIAGDTFKLIDFKNEYFQNDNQLDEFVSKCDVIVHLAAMNRHSEDELIYNTNILLVRILVDSLERTNSSAHVIMSSSLQEEKNNSYGKSKRDGRKLFLKWASNSKGIFSGLLISNVFGPFGRPNYNSVVATFCAKVTAGEKPEIHDDRTINLIYVGEVVQEILSVIEKGVSNKKLMVKSTTNIKVSQILDLLNSYKRTYQDNGEIPTLNSTFEYDLFNTFRCYMDLRNYFPVKFTKHSDSRGAFAEIIRLGIGGQVSFSTTLPGITRGNHFHTRKIERFAVIKGRALIQLRRIGTKEILSFYLNGDEPAYVDIPIWHTHNIKNISDEVLYTNFWINEAYNAETADTYFLEV